MNPFPPHSAKSPACRVDWPIVSLAAAVLISLAACSEALGQSPSVERVAESVLGQRGLLKLGTGAVWITTAELELRGRLAELDRGRDRVQALSKQLNERIDQNAATLRLLEQTQARLKEAKTEAQKRALRQSRDVYSAQCVKPEELGGQDDVRAMLIELTNQRDELLLAVLAVHRLEAQIKGEYALLADDARVAAALAQLGDGVRLGPAKDYDSDMRRLPDFERLVLTDALPLFVQGAASRMSAIVNDRHALVFTWEGGGSHVVITTNMAELAGLDVSRGSLVRLRIAGRDVAASGIQISSLRLGKHVLRDVPVHVLPPDCEDLGARIGPKALGKLVATLQPERLQILIQ